MKRIFLLLGISILFASNAYATSGEGSFKSIMQQLASDYHMLNQAILMDDYDGAATSANKIANHGKPSMFQKMKVMSALGADMPNFRTLDEKVHKLALDIEKSAKAKDMKQLIQQQSQMLSACMTCHIIYRHKLMDILK